MFVLLTAVSTALHARNRHLLGYDMARLVSSHAALAPFLRSRPDGKQTVDFSDPAAVSTLNTALLVSDYSYDFSLPPGHLTPAVPGRADYIHLLADLLAEDGTGEVPTGRSVVGMDVGVGASGVYPLVGHADYGWSFLGTDVSRASLESCERLARRNAVPLELRRQAEPRAVLRGVLQPTDRLAFTMCNPPFYASAEEARAATARKWRGLGKGARLGKGKGEEAWRSFAGQPHELYCDGGERAFVRRLIRESAAPERRKAALWFTSLVSAARAMPALRAELRDARPAATRELALSTSNKGMRVLAWTFQGDAERSRAVRALHKNARREDDKDAPVG